jgi:hypothetical protein
MDLINKSIDKITEGGHEFSAMLIAQFGAAAWLEFLNADPVNPDSMWPAYMEYTRFIDAIKGLVTEQGYSYSRNIEEMELLSRDEFLRCYPAKLQTDAQKIHAGMKKVIDEDMPDVMVHMVRYVDEPPQRTTKKRQEKYRMAEEILTGGAVIPPSSFTILPCLIEENGRYVEGAQLYTPSCQHPNFWLSVISEAMTFLAYDPGIGEIRVERCEAPDCQRYFVPAYRSHDQRYHSKSCQKRHYMQIYRKKG